MAVNLFDTFTGADNSAPSATNWIIGNLVAKAASGTPKIVGNQLSLQTVDAVGLCGIISATAFNATKSGIQVRLTQVGTGATPGMYLSSSGATGSTQPYHRMLVESNLLYVQDSGGFTANGPYDAVAHQYIRLQNDAGNIQAYVSPDGITWNAFLAARPSLITLATAKAGLSVEFGTSTTPALFDDFKQYTTDIGVLAQDSFTGTDGASFDGAKWVVQGSGNVTGYPQIVTNTLAFKANGTTAGGIISKTKFDFNGVGGIIGKLAHKSTTTNTTIAMVLNATGSGAPTSRFSILQNTSTLFLQSSDAYNFSRAFDPVADAYWRIQYDAGSVGFYTSPTAAVGTWVQVGTTQTATIVITAGKASFEASDLQAADPYRIDDYQADNFTLATSSLVAPPATVSVGFNTVDGRIFRHSAAIWSAAATGPIKETGSYAGFTPNQIRLVQDGTNTALTGFDWTTITTVAGGSYAHTFTGVPQGVGTGWYNAQIRDSAVPATVYTSGKRGVGVHIANYGQSQSTNQANTGDSTLTPSGMARVHGDNIGGLWNWSLLDTTRMNGYIAADIQLNAALGGKIPIAFLNLGYPGTGLVAGGPNGNWLPLTGSFYQYGKNLIAGLEGTVDAFVDIRGESDAAGSVTQANYYNGLTTLYTQTRTDVGNANLPIIMVNLGRTFGTSPYFTDAQAEEIKKAFVQKSLDANIYRIECYDASILASDGLHRDATGCALVGKRWARAVLKTMGLAATYRSPRITAFSQISSTIFDATITHDVGSDYTPLSAITGVRITDGATVVMPASVVHQAANKIRVTLSTAPVAAPKLAVDYGANTITNFADNSGYSLPLEYTDGMTAVAADIAAPVMVGAITVSAITSTSCIISWPAATDDVAVTGYEVSIDNGATYTNIGNVLTITETVLAPATPYYVKVRAYDAAGNRAIPLSATATTLAAAVTPTPTPTPTPGTPTPYLVSQEYFSASMNRMPLFVGEYGRLLNFGTQFDMSAATSLSIVFTRPDGTTFNPTAALGTVPILSQSETFAAYQYCYYTFAIGDLNQSGLYSARVSYTDAYKHLLTPAYRFNVQP